MLMVSIGYIFYQDYQRKQRKLRKRMNRSHVNIGNIIEDNFDLTYVSRGYFWY